MVGGCQAGAATSDRVKQDRAVSDLGGYTQDFGAFLAEATPTCRRPSWRTSLRTTCLMLKAVIDAQSARDQDHAFDRAATGAGDMQIIADPLAGAIV